MSEWGRFGGAVGGPDDATSRRMERRFDDGLTAPARPSSRARATWIVVAVAAAAALILLVARPAEHSTVPTGSTVTIATTARAQEVGLPHGGLLRVGVDSRIELEASDETGARVRLHEGDVVLEVESAEGCRWIVEVAAFSVEAVGTKFGVRRTDGAPEVVVDEGVVRLIGPGLPEDGLRIAAGEPPVEPRRTAAAPTADPPRVAAPQAEVEPELELEPDPTPAPKAPPPWLAEFREATEAGDHERASTLLPEGFPSGHEPFASADFLDAGDALAAAGQGARAERAYRAACRRPSAKPCATATFRLALLHARRGDQDEAIDLATRYLEDHPDGPLAREALGRRMQWRLDRGRATGARDDATAYLARWPHGPHAALAQGILEEDLGRP